MTRGKKRKRPPWAGLGRKERPPVIAEASPEQRLPVVQFHPDFNRAGVPANATQVWRTKGGYIVDCIQVVPQGGGEPVLYMVSRVMLPTLSFAALLEQGEQLVAEEAAELRQRDAVAASLVPCPECPGGQPPRIDCDVCGGTGQVVTGEGFTEEERQAAGLAEIRERDAEAELEGDGSGEALPPVAVLHTGTVAEAREAAGVEAGERVLTEAQAADSQAMADAGDELAAARSPLLANRDPEGGYTVDEEETLPDASVPAPDCKLALELLAKARAEDLTPAPDDDVPPLVEAAIKEADTALAELALVCTCPHDGEGHRMVVEPGCPQHDKLPQVTAGGNSQCDCGMVVANSWACCPKCGRNLALADDPPDEDRTDSAGGQ